MDTTTLDLKANASMKFVDYVVGDEFATLHFLCSNPGPGQPSDYYIKLLNSDIETILTAGDFNTLIQTALKRKYRADGIAQYLDRYKDTEVII